MSKLTRTQPTRPNHLGPNRKPSDPTLATVGDKSTCLEIESSGSVGGSSHEKLNPTDLTEIRYSHKQNLRDPAKSQWDPSRSGQISSRFRWDFVEIQLVLAVSAVPLVLTKTDAVQSIWNRIELCFLAVDGRLNFLSSKVVKSVPGWAQTQPRPTHG